MRARRGASVAALALAAMALGGCEPNPRREMPAVVGAALTYVARSGPTCIERVIAPWTPSRSLRRHESDAPPGFERLFRPGVFRGGGGIKTAPAGIRIAARSECRPVRGPLILGDRAMLRVSRDGGDRKLWLAKEEGHWQVVADTPAT